MDNVLIEELKLFQSESNEKIINCLIDVIIENNIDTYRELADLENNYFDKNMSLLDRINLSYKQMIKDIYKFDSMDNEEIVMLDELKDKFNKSCDVEEKLILIIKIYVLLHYQMIFPFCCYKLVYERKI